MASLVLKTLTDIKLMPIKALSIYEGVSTFTDIFHVERGSFITFDEITSASSLGGLITHGYNVHAEVIVSYNQYDANGLIEKLQLYQKYIVDASRNISDVQTRYDIQFMLGTDTTFDEGTKYDEVDVLNANSGMWVELTDRCTVTYSVGTLDYRPALTIKIDGVFTVEEMTDIFQ